MAEFVFVNAKCVTVNAKEEFVEEDPLMELSNSKTGD